VIGKLNPVLWSKNIQHKSKKLIYHALVQSIIWCRNTDTNIQQDHKLLAAEMGFWGRKSRREKVRNDTIRAIMNAGKNILEVTTGKGLRWFGHAKRIPGNRLPRKVLECEPEGTRRGRPKER
jgi:hypothetical protein